jgi:hypothetical protein
MLFHISKLRILRRSVETAIDHSFFAAPISVGSIAQTACYRRNVPLQLRGSGLYERMGLTWTERSVELLHSHESEHDWHRASYRSTQIAFRFALPGVDGWDLW